MSKRTQQRNVLQDDNSRQENNEETSLKIRINSVFVKQREEQHGWDIVGKGWG
jgi:hypothetical protein